MSHNDFSNTELKLIDNMFWQAGIALPAQTTNRKQNNAKEANS